MIQTKRGIYNNLDGWPDCEVPGCDNKRCDALSSEKCGPHTVESNENGEKSESVSDEGSHWEVLESIGVTDPKLNSLFANFAEEISIDLANQLQELYNTYPVPNVTCDYENNSEDDIKNGRMVVDLSQPFPRFIPPCPPPILHHTFDPPETTSTDRFGWDGDADRCQCIEPEPKEILLLTSSVTECQKCKKIKR